ncbi:MAG: hypothetical protein M3509_03925 [Chloroflexota bacterium]|nr:hypothetical protein [Chloroflexota bacterium]
MSTALDAVDNAARDEEQIVPASDIAWLDRQFLQEALADPDRLDRIPNGAVLVIVPTDDAELAATELAKADRMRADGRTVHIERIWPRQPDPPPWWLAERVPANLRASLPVAESLLNGPGLTVVFDQSRDLLLASERRGQQPGLAWPLSGGPVVLVDTSTNRAFAFLVPDFVTRTIPRRPHLAYILAMAELRPLRPDDVGDFALPAAHEAEVAVPARPEPLSPEHRATLVTAFGELTGEANASCVRTQFFQSD